MKILNFGSLNIDYVYTVDEFVKPGETVIAYDLQTYPGGKGLNQSIAAARAGGEVYHAGHCGNQALWLLSYLQKSKVSTKFVLPVNEMQGNALIEVNRHGENRIIVYRGSNAQLTRDYIDATLQSFSREDCMLLQNEINDISYIIKQAAQRGIKVLLNPSPIDNNIFDIELDLVDWLLVNEIEASAIIKEPLLPNDFLAKFSAQHPHTGVVLTLGKKGVICMQNGKIEQHSAYKVNAIDTTGAGDTFTGYFAAGIAFGKPISQILQTATKAAAICVSRKGAAPSIPTSQEVEQFV